MSPFDIEGGFEIPRLVDAILLAALGVAHQQMMGRMAGGIQNLLDELPRGLALPADFRQVDVSHIVIGRKRLRESAGAATGYGKG